MLRFEEPELMRSVYNLVKQQIDLFKAADEKEPWERIGRMGMLPVHEIFQEQFPNQAHNVRENIMQQPVVGHRNMQPPSLRQQVQQPTVAVINTSVQNEPPAVVHVSSLMAETHISSREEEVDPRRSFPYSNPYQPSNPNPVNNFVTPETRPDLFPPRVAAASSEINGSPGFATPETRPDLFSNRANLSEVQREGSSSTIPIVASEPDARSNVAMPSNDLNRVVGRPGRARDASYAASPALGHPMTTVDARGEGEENVAYYSENDTGDIIVQLG